VHVAPPVTPVSSMLLGHAPTAFYAIIAVIAGIVTGTILVLNKKRSSARLL
jgi:hypothetical protein